MKKHRMSRKELKKELFFSEISQLSDWVWSNRNTAFIILVSALALLIAYISLSRHNLNRRNESLSALNAALVLQRSGKTASFQEDLQRIAERYAGLDAGHFASLLLIEELYRQAHYSDVVDWSQKLLKHSSSQSLWAAKSLLIQAAAYEQMQEYDYALKRLRQFVKQFPQHALLPEAYLAMARSHHLKHQTDQARKQCEIVLDQFADTHWAQTASEMLVNMLHSSVRS